MPEPTLAALLTRIEILERHVERLERQGKAEHDALEDCVASIYDAGHGEDQNPDACDLCASHKAASEVLAKRIPSPSQTRGSVADPDRAPSAAQCRPASTELPGG